MKRSARRNFIAKVCSHLSLPGTGSKKKRKRKKIDICLAPAAEKPLFSNVHELPKPALRISELVFVSMATLKSRDEEAPTMTPAFFGGSVEPMWTHPVKPNYRSCNERRRHGLLKDRRIRKMDRVREVSQLPLAEEML
jgi:hypothetical protein